MFYNIHNGYQETLLHIMNAAEVYEKCQSWELTTFSNKSGLCDCYNIMKRYCIDFAKYVAASDQENVKCEPEMWLFWVIFPHWVSFWQFWPSG